jgi:biotin operon repressor
LKHLKKESERIKNLVQGTGALTEAQRGMYYSNWYFVAIRTLSALSKFQSVEALSEYLGLPRAKVGEAVSFLLETGLCIEHEKGKIRQGQRQIHVDDKNPYVNNHRRNWREKAREKFTNPGDMDLFYSSVVTLSENDADQFRKSLLQLIQEFSKTVKNSPDETFRCLNIDWFKF